MPGARRKLVPSEMNMKELNEKLSIISRVVVHLKYQTIGLGARVFYIFRRQIINFGLREGIISVQGGKNRLMVCFIAASLFCYDFYFRN